MSAKQSRSRRARFESLEPKQLLAGDVLVSVVEGRLIVEGDELGNQIAITAGPEPGTYTVHGLDGTNVILQPPPMDPAATPEPAGEPTSTVVVHGVRSVGIGMGDGDDRVVLREVNFRGDVGIRRRSQLLRSRPVRRTCAGGKSRIAHRRARAFRRRSRLSSTSRRERHHHGRTGDR